jgi:hypothetical protein
MGGSQPRSQTTVSQVQYPPWLEGPMRDNIARANQIADQRDQEGYQGYDPQDRIAGLNDLQMNALQNTRDSVGNWTPLMQQGVNATTAGQNAATDIARSGGVQAAYAGPGALVRDQNFLGANLEGYMNPYTDMVTRNALGNLEESRQVANVNNADAATKARAFGGSRHGVVEAQTNAAASKAAGDLALNAAQANFANAQGQFNTDANRNLQAQGMNQNSWNQANQFNAGLAQQANLAGAQNRLSAAGQLGQFGGQFGNLASQYQGLNSNDLNNLFSAGGILQEQDQLGRDFAYQEFLNRQNYPIDNLNLRFSAINNTPYQPGSSTSSPIYRNRSAGFLGGASAGFGMGGIPGALIGGLLGGLG